MRLFRYWKNVVWHLWNWKVEGSGIAVERFNYRTSRLIPRGHNYSDLPTCYELWEERQVWFCVSFSSPWTYQQTYISLESSRIGDVCRDTSGVWLRSVWPYEEFLRSCPVVLSVAKDKHLTVSYSLFESTRRI